jgi:hypothetical protein
VTKPGQAYLDGSVETSADHAALRMLLIREIWRGARSDSGAVRQGRQALAAIRTKVGGETP